MFIATSGTMGYGNGHPVINKILTPNLFDLIVTKTLTPKPKKGNLGLNPLTVIKPINTEGQVDYVNDVGVVNAVGLTNKGIDWWINKYYPKISHKEKIIVSITPNVDIRKLNKLDIHGIELNLSCPNDFNLSCLSDAGIQYILKYLKTDHRVYLKIGIHQKVADLSNIEAVSFNSVPWRRVFPTAKSPLEKYNDGSVSGKIIHNLIPKDYEVPVIRGIWDERTDRLMGVGSVSFLHPFRVRKLIKES